MGKLGPKEGKGFGLDHTERWGQSENPALPTFDVGLFLPRVIPASSCLSLARGPLEIQAASLSLILHPCKLVAESNGSVQRLDGGQIKQLRWGKEKESGYLPIGTRKQIGKNQPGLAVSQKHVPGLPCSSPRNILAQGPDTCCALRPVHPASWL